MRIMTKCPKCQRQYDTNTIYAGCPYCLRRQLARIPKHIREAEQAARDTAIWQGIVNGGRR